jgi:geranylgeranylglycerol-phosphate geranylgeranyltransferase
LLSRISSNVQRALDIFRLIRVWNCLLATAGVWVGAYLTWLKPMYYGPLMAGSAAFLVCATGNVFNDLRDIEIDRINRPDRVLVRGAISTGQAIWLAIICAVAAIVLAVAVNWLVLVAVLAALVLVLAYDFGLKKIPVVGNLSIAVLSAFTFMTGGLSIGPKLALVLPGPLIPAVFALLFHMVREILKDAEDIEGDRRLGITTLPQIIGESKSLMVALLFFFVLVVLTYIPVIEGWFGRAYEIITVYMVDIPLLALLIFVWGNPTRRMLRVGSLGLKLGMLLGLVALLVS